MNTIRLLIRRKVDERRDWLAQEAQSLVRETEIYKTDSGMKDDQLRKIALLASWTQSLGEITARLEHQIAKDLKDIKPGRPGKRWAWGVRDNGSNKKEAFGERLKKRLNTELHTEARRLVGPSAEEELVKEIHIRLVRAFLQFLIWTFGYQNVTQGG